MSKQKYQIRWRDSDTAELQRVINNFNAKIYRLRKSRPELADVLPSTVNKTTLIQGIQTRADFNNTIKSLQRFSRRGAEEKAPSKRGRKTTRWEDRETAIKRRVYEAQKSKKRKEIEKKPVTTRGKTTGVSRAEMGSIKENNLKPSKRNPENMSQKEWEYHKRLVDRALNPLTSELDKYNMRMNYIKGLRNAGFSDDVADLVRQMDIDKFIETVETDEQAEFDFIYDPIEFDLKDEALRQTWQAALDKQNTAKG